MRGMFVEFSGNRGIGAWKKNLNVSWNGPIGNLSSESVISSYISFKRTVAVAY